MGFFLGTQERVRNNRGKRAIIVRATEVLLDMCLHVFAPFCSNDDNSDKTHTHTHTFFVYFQYILLFPESVADKETAEFNLELFSFRPFLFD